MSMDFDQINFNKWICKHKIFNNEGWLYA
jgi:hypothetical protein